MILTLTARYGDDALVPLAVFALEYPYPFSAVREHGAQFAQERPRCQGAIQYVASVRR